MINQKFCNSTHNSASRFGLLLGIVGLTLGIPITGSAASYDYDFGTGTGTYTTSSTSTTFLPTPATGGGSSYVRVGSAGGGFALNNPGIVALGSGSELAITGPTSASINKFAINNYTAGATSRLAFSAVLGGNSGTFSVFTGNGSSFDTASSSFASADYVSGLRFVLGGTTNTPTVTTTYRSGGSSGAFSSTGLTTSGITTGTVLGFEIYGNNSTSAVSYFEGSTNYSVAAGTYDIFLNGTLIGDDLAKGGLTASTIIDSFMFYGESSTGNVGTLTLDDISYGDITPVPEPTTVLSGLLLIGAAGLAQRRQLRTAYAKVKCSLLGAVRSLDRVA